MMKPTRMQYFFAQDWPLKFWFVGVMVFAAIAAGCACQPSLALFKDWHFLVLFIFAILVAPVFAFFLSLPITWLIVGPFYYARAKLNGAPFQVGDHVQILAGPHRDKIGKIYSAWQGGTFRVELGSEAEKSYKDVFSETQLVRITKPDPVPANVQP